jgi:hypothetical protein
MFIALFVTNCLMVAHSQDVTLLQCRTDIGLAGTVEERTTYFNAETEHINSGLSNPSRFVSMPMRELNRRIGEMSDCYFLTEQDQYHEALVFYQNVKHDRIMRFLRRHHLMDQLEAEDDKGAR